MKWLEIADTDPRPDETKPATAMSITDAGEGKVKIALAHNEIGIHIITNEFGATRIISMIEAALEGEENHVRSH